MLASVERAMASASQSAALSSGSKSILIEMPFGVGLRVPAPFVAVTAALSLIVGDAAT